MQSVCLRSLKQRKSGSKANRVFVYLQMKLSDVLPCCLVFTWHLQTQSEELLLCSSPRFETVHSLWCPLLVYAVFGLTEFLFCLQHREAMKALQHNGAAAFNSSINTVPVMYKVLKRSWHESASQMILSHSHAADPVTFSQRWME